MEDCVPSKVMGQSIPTPSQIPSGSRAFPPLPSRHPSGRARGCYREEQGWGRRYKRR